MTNYIQDEKQYIINEALGKTPSIVVNDVDLEKEVPGFTFLKVDGRGMPTKKVQILDNEYTEGAKISSNKLGSITLTIHYLIRAETTQDFLKSVAILHSHLQGDLEVTFGDETRFHYTGVLNTFEEITEHAKAATGTFTIFCPLPYKLSKVIEFIPSQSSFENGKVKINMPYVLNDVRVRRIFIEYTEWDEDIRTIEVIAYNKNNDVKRLRFFASGTGSGKIMDVTFNEFGELKEVFTERGPTLNGLQFIDITSDLEDFTYGHGSEIRVNFLGGDWGYTPINPEEFKVRIEFQERRI